MLPDPIKKFVDLFSKLPGIGPRQATRLAFHISGTGKSNIEELAKIIYGLSDIKTCSLCFTSHNNAGYETRSARENTKKNLCPICSNPQRRKDIIAIIEKETDLISLEKTKKFDGRYLVLGDLKKDGVLESVQKLRLNSLKNWIKKEFGGQAHSAGSPRQSSGQAGQAEEIILAMNPTTYGDLNASLIANELKDSAKKITRLGRRIPTGGEIEFADEETLGAALDKRG